MAAPLPRTEDLRVDERAMGTAKSHRKLWAAAIIAVSVLAIMLLALIPPSSAPVANAGHHQHTVAGTARAGRDRYQQRPGAATGTTTEGPRARNPKAEKAIDHSGKPKSLTTP